MKMLVQFGRKLWKDEDGLGTLEILLIVAVLVIIAIMFRKWIIHYIEELFGQSNNELKDAGKASEACRTNPASCGTASP
ncbi:Flp1 family type IVb pilin [Paenibacillus thalictri]|uniref:Putative Flagellin Flp1-like domain-containing protein n=1 Tax=Paenibacillus thalictri TaxID=2527873 RepID=A0A4Q9DV58_9BACL|nr:Flp1 family type IVb pilin [Paenibacillus thalictri]TBL80245.1 hypothetical protein EYB31_07450 [Paenibacillus thalictri]